MVKTISHVNHSYAPTKSKSADNTDDQIKSLQGQVDDLKKQIAEIRSGKSSNGSNIEEQIKPLQKQIDQIEAQIQELQLNKATDKTDDNNSNDSSKVSDTKDNSNEDAVLMYGNVYNEISKASGVGKHLKGEAAVLKSDADVDEGLGDYRGADKKRKIAARDEARANSAIGKVYKLEKKAVDSADKVNKDQDKNDTDRYTAEGKSVDDSAKGKAIDKFA